MKPLPPADGFLSRREAAAYLALSLRSLDKVVSRGAILAFKPPIGTEKGYKLLFRRRDLDAFVERYPASQDLDQIVDQAVAGLGGEK